MVKVWIFTFSSHKDLNNHEVSWDYLKELVGMMNNHKVNIHLKEFKKEIMDEFINYSKLKICDIIKRLNLKPHWWIKS